MPIISLENRNQWGSIIRIRSIHESIPLFQEVLAIRRTLPTPISSEMNLHLAFAFAELMNKFHRKKQYSFMKKLHCPVSVLKELADISIDSYTSPKMQGFGINIMLEVAGHLPNLEWADYVYQLAQTKGIADAITHGTAIKLLGHAKRFQEAEEAFERLNQLDNPSPSAMAVAHGAMIQACFINEHYSHALEIYRLAEDKNLANAIIRTTMIKIAGCLAMPKLAENLLNLVISDPKACDYTIKIAQNHFRCFVRDVASNPFEEKELHIAPPPPALSPAAKQTPAMPLHSEKILSSPSLALHLADCSAPIFSEDDPIYTPPTDQPSPGRGPIGSRVGVDVPLRPTAAEWRPNLFKAKAVSRYNSHTVSTEANASSPTPHP